ncbi:hypothetical protein GA0115259_103418 [Streptomyces sp. MnatMP-M17]|nr:hypothetical protein GA0115259_103418 [Streptomyces sp. MnatMP-M17]
MPSAPCAPVGLSEVTERLRTRPPDFQGVSAGMNGNVVILDSRCGSGARRSPRAARR